MSIMARFNTPTAVSLVPLPVTRVTEKKFLDDVTVPFCVTGAIVQLIFYTTILAFTS